MPKAKRKTKRKAKAQAKPTKPKPGKFHNKKVRAFGIEFDSKREANRYPVLRAMERAGEITGLELQKRIQLWGQFGPILTVHGHPRYYLCDYYYYEVATGKNIIEDVKGMKTDMYRLKKAILAAMGLDIREI